MNSEWIFENGKYPVCKNCNYIMKTKHATPYCPFCGCYMKNYLSQEQTVYKVYLHKKLRGKRARNKYKE